MTQLRIGLAQARQTDSLEENSRIIDRFIDDAAQAGVQVLCFPESQTVGYRVDIIPLTVWFPLLNERTSTPALPRVVASWEWRSYSGQRRRFRPIRRMESHTTLLSSSPSAATFSGCTTRLAGHQ